MLRSNAYCGEVRETNLLRLSNCSIDSKKARSCKRIVSEVSSWPSGTFFSSRKIKSSKQGVFSRCWFSKFKIFFKIFGYDPLHEFASTSNNTNNVSRSWSNSWKLDQKQKGISWTKALRISVATGITLLLLVRAVLTGTTLRLTPTTTTACVVPVTTIFGSGFAKAVQADSINKWWSANFILLWETHSWVRFSV